jgi:DNA transposition AAA+ family ATPase
MMKDTGIDRASSIGQTLYDIVGKLKGSNRLIIIDDAHFLTWEAYESVRKIYDYADVGVIYSGQERLYEQMKGQAQRAYLYDQIYSRIAIKRDKFKILKKDSSAIINAVCPGLSHDCLDFLYNKAQGKGRYRYMINILDVAMMMHEQYEKDIDIKCLTEAERFLIGE